MKETKFKQTEVGMIPCDWMVESLANIANTASGGTPSRSNEAFYKGSIKWFTTTELKDCNLYDSVEHISKQAVECSSAKIFPKDTLLMAMYGATIGKLGLLKCDAATNQACCAIFPKKTDVLYLYYFLLHNRENIIAMGCGAGQPNVSQEIVKKINIPIPPTIKEQQRIANALSDIDTLIANLEKLIAKKKNIKQGAMQQLLTGKKRLPGFGLDERRKEKKGNRHCSSNHDCCDLPMREQVPVQSNLARHCERSEAIQSSYKMTELGLIPSDWEVKNLGSITQNCSYGVGAEAVSFNGRTKYIRITDIDDDSHRFIPSPLTSPSFYENKHVVQENDLLIARTGASVGKTYLYDSKDGKLIFAGFLIKMNVCEANSKFVFYSTLTKYYQDWIVSESARTGQPGVNLQQMKKLQIALPPTIEEQTAIANVLSDMDTEIATLETKLAKYRTLKTGMMQQLLTGKIRLI